tara:strand:- start:628 stop:822 length:195 start_codon:yes stop_codon:yes gene_type:complete
MTSSLSKNKQKKPLNKENSAIESNKILSDITRKDIEKSYSLESIKGTEAYYSDRYGWTLRKSID